MIPERRAPRGSNSGSPYKVRPSRRAIDLKLRVRPYFLILQRTAFQEPTSYFHHYRDLPASRAREVANGIWREINLVNLRENILPTRTRADVVLRKRSDHSVGEIWLRQT